MHILEKVLVFLITLRQENKSVLLFVIDAFICALIASSTRIAPKKALIPASNACKFSMFSNLYQISDYIFNIGSRIESKIILKLIKYRLFADKQGVKESNFERRSLIVIYHNNRTTLYIDRTIVIKETMYLDCRPARLSQSSKATSFLVSHSEK